MVENQTLLGVWLPFEGEKLFGILVVWEYIGRIFDDGNINLFLWLDVQCITTLPKKVFKASPRAMSQSGVIGVNVFRTLYQFQEG